MLDTRLCHLLDITHPVVLGGMGVGNTPELAAAVSNAGGLGILGGCAGLPADAIKHLAADIRRLTGRPFGLNMLLFRAGDDDTRAVLAARPSVFSSSWARGDQDLTGLFARAHDSGCKVMHMVSTVEEAVRAADAGAEIIVAQGSEGGGHVGLMSTAALMPLVVRAVAPVPVVAAGGLADGAGLAAVLLLGAEGALYGTRFLASKESSLPPALKQAIVRSDGHDSLLTELPDVAMGMVWPGAYARVKRNQFIERWLGREGALRYRQAEAADRLRAAFEAGDPEEAVIYMGLGAGLIDSVQEAGVLVEQIVGQATRLLGERAPSLLSAR